MIFALLADFALGYLLGSIPFGLLVARSQGVDIRKTGSGNIGATNVWRVMGRKWGMTTFLCDFGKGLLAVLIARQLAAHWVPAAHADDVNYAGIAAAIGCILGHSFPVWLGFKGGKGVATSLGVIAGMMPLASLSIFLVWLIVLKVTRYVSLASIMAALSLPLFVVAFLFLGWMHGWAAFYFSVAATILVVVRHTGNIRRLLAGTENRMGARKADETGEPSES
jgi:glycerol-3-phosphate acyltransferase PlsY